VVQVNGKIRAKISVACDLTEEQLRKQVLADAKVAEWVGQKPIKKFLVVPNKIVSIVL